MFRAQPTLKIWVMDYIESWHTPTTILKMNYGNFCLALLFAVKENKGTTVITYSQQSRFRKRRRRYSNLARHFSAG